MHGVLEILGTGSKLCSMFSREDTENVAFDPLEAPGAAVTRRDAGERVHAHDHAGERFFLNVLNPTQENHPKPRVGWLAFESRDFWLHLRALKSLVTLSLIH